MTVYQPRPVGRVNWLGLWTHYSKEVRRFLKVWLQTLMAPVITTLLFLAIFTLALGRTVPIPGDITFAEFLAPGLIMMAVIQNSFANSSSSVMMAKIQGNIVDVLMPPLSAAELCFGFVVGAVTRGLMVALFVGAGLTLFVPLHAHSIVAMVYFAASASLSLSLLGVITGIWAEKYDHLASITNFIITPLSFLSGTFYSIHRLPGIALDAAYLNPFFYMIDGFRYGFIGHADASLIVGAGYLAAVNIVLWVLCQRMLATGYKLKA